MDLYSSLFNACLEWSLGKHSMDCNDCRARLGNFQVIDFDGVGDAAVLSVIGGRDDSASDAAWGRDVTES